MDVQSTTVAQACFAQRACALLDQWPPFERQVQRVWPARKAHPFSKLHVEVPHQGLRVHTVAAGLAVQVDENLPRKLRPRTCAVHQSISCDGREHADNPKGSDTLHARTMIDCPKSISKILPEARSIKIGTEPCHAVGDQQLLIV